MFSHLQGTTLGFRVPTFLNPGWVIASAIFLLAFSGRSAGQNGALPATVPAPAHGMFIFNPPIADQRCGINGWPRQCFSAHLLPTLICTGKDTPAGYNCTQAGAGSAYVKGAVFDVPWGVVNPGNDKYDFSQLDNWMQPWVAAGKLVSFIFEPTSNYGGYMPAWYMAQVPIATVSQTAGIISLNTAAAMEFFPGGAAASTGLEIQISGTGTALDGDGTIANPGIWKVCDHTTPGCQDPSLQTIYAIGGGSDIAPVSTGTVGNPVYGSADGSTCTSGVIPIEWRINFIHAWRAVIRKATAHYASNPSIGYMRFGMGIGGQSNPTSGANLTGCQAQMTQFGFTSVSDPWPLPGKGQWPQVAVNWIDHLNNMCGYIKSQNGTSPAMITISPIEFNPEDFSTANATAANASYNGLGFGSQGLQKSDPVNFAAGKPCAGGNWCANFQKHKGKVTLELQTLFYSDPTNVSETGSLAILLPFATSVSASVFELYMDDWMCTYDSTWAGNNTYSACQLGGYPAAFAAAAASVN